MSDFTPRYLADYREANFSIATVELTFALDEYKTRVTNRMKLSRVADDNQPLVLDGEHLTLVSVLIDDQALNAEQYQVSELLLLIVKSSRLKLLLRSIQLKIRHLKVYLSQVMLIAPNVKQRALDALVIILTDPM